MNDRPLDGAPFTIPEPRRASTGPFLTAVLGLSPTFVPPEAALVEAFELPDLSAGSVMFTTGNHTAYHVSLQRHPIAPDLGEIIPAAVRVDLSSGSTRYDIRGPDYVQVVLVRHSGLVVNVNVPFVDAPEDKGQALANLASQLTELLDVTSTDLIGLSGPDHLETRGAEGASAPQPMSGTWARPGKARRAD
jgi:hypothetical protein